MAWNFPSEPPAGAAPYYEYPPIPNASFSGGSGSNAGWQAGAAPPATPLPFRLALKQLPRQYWRVLTKPGAATFAQEMGKAEWGIIWAQVLGYAAVAAVLGILAWLVIIALWGVFLNAILSASPYGGSFPLTAPFLLGSIGGGIIIFCVVFLAAIGGFFFNQGILYLLAKAFGGQGRFVTQVYTALLFQVPIGLVSGLLTLIPVLGSLVGSAASIYGLVLQIFAIMPVHRLSGGKASAVVLIPVAVGYLLATATYVLYLVFIFSTLNTVIPSQ